MVRGRATVFTRATERQLHTLQVGLVVRQQERHTCTPQAVTVALEWRNLTYTVPVGKDKGKKKSTKVILDRLTGVAPPGHLLAIMGPTGAPLPSRLRMWDMQPAEGAFGGVRAWSSAFDAHASLLLHPRPP
jgi:hypothetical protein